MIESAQVNYISYAGSNSKKGFQAYKRFMSQLEAKRHMKDNNFQSTVWDKIKRYERKKNGV